MSQQHAANVNEVFSRVNRKGEECGFLSTFTKLADQNGWLTIDVCSYLTATNHRKANMYFLCEELNTYELTVVKPITLTKSVLFKK